MKCLPTSNTHLDPAQRGPLVALSLRYGIQGLNEEDKRLIGLLQVLTSCNVFLIGTITQDPGDRTARWDV